MVDIAVKSGSAWHCHTQGHHLSDILLPVYINDEEKCEEFGNADEEERNGGSPVLLKQAEEGYPCVLTLQCSPCSTTAISRLLVISGARTMEVYSHMGEYCGTARGETCVQPDKSDSGPFYKKQLILRPSLACEVKLLSLAGRSNVLVRRVIVGLQRLPPDPAHGPGIDMRQVQCLVDEMGTSLSPGAQNLMDMVQFQQKNQTSSLGSFLPLLMGGGVFSALAEEARISPAAILTQAHPADLWPPACSITPVEETPQTQNGANSDDSSSCSPDVPVSESTESRGPTTHAELALMMSHLLKVQEPDQTLTTRSDLLPMLQSVCGQVAKLRIDEAAVALETEKKMRNGKWELDSAMEHRLEEMEKRLKEHVDRRLDALEQKLERALLSVLPQVALNHGVVSNSLGESASTGRSEQTAPTSAML